VVSGEQSTGAAIAAMQQGGVVFAPYMELPQLGPEATDQHYRCIDAVNRAVGERLASRYAVRVGSPAADPRTRLPAWALSPGGPRVAVHIDAFQCGKVLGDPGSVAAKSYTEDPGNEHLGVVVLTVHDRTTGNAVIRIRGEANEGNGLAAVVGAAAAAIEVLVPATN